MRSILRPGVQALFRMKSKECTMNTVSCLLLVPRSVQADHSRPGGTHHTRRGPRPGTILQPQLRRLLDQGHQSPRPWASPTRPGGAVFPDSKTLNFQSPIDPPNRGSSDHSRSGAKTPSPQSIQPQNAAFHAGVCIARNASIFRERPRRWAWKTIAVIDSEQTKYWPITVPPPQE